MHLLWNILTDWEFYEEVVPGLSIVNKFLHFEPRLLACLARLTFNLSRDRLWREKLVFVAMIFKFIFFRRRKIRKISDEFLVR